MSVTGKTDLAGFWKMSPAELFAWCDAMGDGQEDLFEGIEMGEEVED